MVENKPLSVVNHLLSNASDGVDIDCDTSHRLKALSLLCQMNPAQMRHVRKKCSEWCKMPSLALHLSCKLGGFADTVGFVSGLLLGPNAQVRVISF